MGKMVPGWGHIDDPPPDKSKALAPSNTWYTVKQLHALCTPELAWRATLLDFRDPAQCELWHTVDDRVMGGSSQSKFKVKPYEIGPGQPTLYRGESRGRCFFEGDLVVEGGGFASGRWLIGQSLATKMRGAVGLLIKARGDGRSGYKMAVKIGELNEERFTSWDEAATANGRVVEGTNYQQMFKPDKDVPTEIMLPFGAFQATHRGEPVLDAPQLTAGAIRHIAIMNSKFEAKPGEDPTLANTTTAPFSLELLTLSAYGCSEHGIFLDREGLDSLPGKKPKHTPSAAPMENSSSLPDDEISLAAIHQLGYSAAARPSNARTPIATPGVGAPGLGASSTTDGVGSVFLAAGASAGGAMGVMALAAVIGFGIASRRSKRQARGSGAYPEQGASLGHFANVRVSGAPIMSK